MNQIENKKLKKSYKRALVLQYSLSLNFADVFFCWGGGGILNKTV